MVRLPQTIAEAAEWLRDGTITSVELAESLLARCHATQNTVAAFITICDDVALAAAQEADVDFALGIDRGPLQGIPFAVKDNLATNDVPTTANSLVLNPAWGASTDATVVRYLRDAGAILVGKLAMDEFGSGELDSVAGFPTTRNPWDLSRIPGGSSSGTAAAVAAGLVLFGLGTDTGGSIRHPAAYCGVTGLKPTFGRVSKAGCVPGAYTLDVVGPMTRTAQDCALVLEVIAGYDSADPNSANMPDIDMVINPAGALEGIRIGLPKDYFFTVPELQPEVKRAVLAAVELMEAAGATIINVNVPRIAEARTAWSIITLAESYAYHEPDLQQQPEQYGLTTRRHLLSGALLTAADYIQAQRLRSIIKADCLAALTDVDVLVIPDGTTTAPLVEEWDPLTTPSFTIIWSLIGVPALTICCGFSDNGLPIGMQIIGRPFDEPTLLHIASEYQYMTQWHTRVPDLAELMNL